jgi:hypothetical protein
MGPSFINGTTIRLKRLNGVFKFIWNRPLLDRLLSGEWQIDRNRWNATDRCGNTIYDGSVAKLVIMSWARQIHIKSPAELQVMREAGRINATVLQQ